MKLRAHTTTYLVPERPQPHSLVLGAAHEAVLVVQAVDGLDGVRVAHEALQLDLLQVEPGLLVRPAYLVLPVDQPVTA